MKKYPVFIAVLLAALLLAACASPTPQVTEAPQPSETPLQPTPEPQEPTAEPAPALQAVPQAELINIVWQWISLVETEPAAQSVVPNPENYTLTFQDDGMVSVQADCNVASGSYQLDGTSISIELGPTTLAACPPESLSDAFLAYVNQAEELGYAGEQLVLVSPAENATLNFANGGAAELPPPADLIPANPEDVIGILWQAVSFNGPLGPVESPDPASYTLVFLPEGEFQIQADCNVGSGRYTLEEAVLDMEVIVYTRAMCPPESLESQYVDLINNASLAVLEEGKLLLDMPEYAGALVFQNGGEFEVAQPLEYDAVVQEIGIDPASVSLDTFDLPYSYSVNVVPGVPYDNTNPPGPSGVPAHIQINFGVVDPAEYQPGDPIIYIIPVENYVAEWDANGDATVSDLVAESQELITNKVTPLPDPLPVLPLEQAVGAQDLTVQSSYWPITMGEGYRFVGRFGQGINPVTNDNLEYIFNGYTPDGTYLIAFFYPVTNGDLPEIDEVTDEETATMEADPAAYLEERTSFLNSLPLDSWDPAITILDAVIASLQFSPLEAGGEIGTPPPAPESITYAWTALTETDPAGQSVVPDPENYTLEFFPDGTFFIVADCNSGSGTYTVDGKKASLNVGPLTKVACGPDSLSDQFLALLADVVSYTVEGEQLVLKTNTGPILYLDKIAP